MGDGGPDDPGVGGARLGEGTAPDQNAKIGDADVSDKNRVFFNTRTLVSPYLNVEVGAGSGQLLHQEKEEAELERQGRAHQSPGQHGVPSQVEDQKNLVFKPGKCN